MKVFKRAVVLFVMFLMLFTIVFAEETVDIFFKATLSDGDVIIEKTEAISDIDNSNLLVEVKKVMDDTETIIYEGPLGNYDNGIWSHTDFNDIDFLVIFDWETMGRETIYVTPVNDDIASATEKTDANNTNTSNNEHAEQASTINHTQYIEYDVTYSIVSDGNIHMNIDYNVYNGGLESDTATLIAGLYENGRLSDMRTQSICVDALESNTDTIILPLPNNREDYSVKLMVWEDMITLKPIGEVKKVIDLDDYTREKYMYVTSNANIGFNVYMNASTVKGANADAVHTLKYDSSKISPVDLCGFTYNKELTTGEIENTNIIVENVDLSAGKIEYKFNLEAGRNTGIINLVKFKTLSDVTDETIVYTIQ